MRSQWRPTTLVTLALLAAGLLVVACGDAHGCNDKSGNALWLGNGFDVSISSPTTCPIQVGANGASLFYGAMASGPRDVLDPNQFAELDIHNFDNQSVTSEQELWYSDVSGYFYDVDFAGYYLVGTYPTGSPPPHRGNDYVTIIALTLPYNELAAGQVTLPYQVGIQAALAGPTTVGGWTSNSWSLSASNGTSPYTYKWLRDGSLQSGQTSTGFSYTPQMFGTFTVSGIATAANSKADTATFTVTSVFSVAISGSVAVDPNTGETWSASIPGGYPPYSYVWSLDGNTAGTSSSFFSYVGDPNTNHTIGLQVTDSHSNVATSSLPVYVTAGGTCLSPPCP